MKRWPLTILLIAYLLLASLYSVVTPIFEASDEIWHYPMVEYLADHALALPVQDPTVSTAWRQEGSQPPLYYMMGAVLTFWIDTSDLDKVRKVNPHADIGVVVPDGNVNMIVHDPAVESFPWRGTVLAVHIVRFMSVALGAVTVAMTYLLTCELFPGKRWLPLGAAAFTAFNPMFLFISGSVNNDNLSNALASLLLVMIVRLLKRTSTPSISDLVLIGITAGAGMLAKFNIGFLLPLIALSLAILAYRLRDWRPFVYGGAITGGLTVVIASWWYIRNAQLYGDLTGLNMFIRIVGPRAIPANLPQLWSERHTFLMSYWGFFGGVNVPLPDVVYTVFNAIAALAAIGLVIGVASWLTRSGKRARHALPLQKQTDGICWPILLGRVVTAIWIVVLFVSLLRWTSTTWASQGRLMFSAIAPLSMWMAVGLWRVGQPFPVIRWRLVATGIGWSPVVAAIALPIIARTYGDPYPGKVAWNGSRIIDASFREPEQTDVSLDVFTPVGYLNSITYDPGHVKVGDYLEFCEYFELLAHKSFMHDWSAVIHLETEDGLIVAQRDVYLGQGLWATSLMKTGADAYRNWCNRFAVLIPDHAYAPQTLRAYLGFYDLRTGVRMVAIPEYLPNVMVKENRVYLGMVQLLPRTSTLDVPNPMSVNFGGEAELVGYDVSSLVLYPDKKVTVTLYWRALRPMTTDYRVFVQVLQPNTTNVFGGSDAMPAGWTRPTTTWKPGEIVKDEHTFTINSDAPPGTWQIVAGMYRLDADNSYHRLRIITPDGGEASDFVELSRVKMNLPEEF